MYILHTTAEHGKYIDSNGQRWDIHVATNPYPVSAWDTYDSVEEAIAAYGLTEIPDVPLYDAKIEATELIQKWIDLSVVAKKEIDCPALGETIVFDRQALINAMAVKPGMYWIGSSNVPHELTTELISGIQEALMTYVQSIYTQATVWRGQVAAVETVEEVKSVIEAVLAAWPAGETIPEVAVVAPADTTEPAPEEPIETEELTEGEEA